MRRKEGSKVKSIEMEGLTEAGLRGEEWPGVEGQQRLSSICESLGWGGSDHRRRIG